MNGTNLTECALCLSDRAFVQWVENRTGLDVGWQSAQSIVRLHGIWLDEQRARR